jgi:UDP-2,4-diacetamido-2,4,6-trideoxy-beta-L-altropyranose hydrolase
MRCLALAQAWKDAGGEVTFITACQSEGLLQQLKEEGFDLHTLAFPHPDPGDWHYTKDILATHPDAWVVLDGYHFDESYQQRVKEVGHRLLVIDDMAHLKHYYADVVLNQNLHAEQLHYSGEPHTRLLLGTRYALLRREFLAWRGWKREIPQAARRVLVTLGGGDPENHTLKVIQALQEVDVPDLEAIVVVGASNPHADVLEAASRQSRVPIRLVRNARNMPELMANADVAVTGGGISSWELAFMGLPSLILAWADSQYPIARALDAAGVAQELRSHRDRNMPATDMGRILVWLLQEAEVRAEMARRGQQLVDGQGAQRVLESLKEENREFIRVSGKTDFTNPSEWRQRADHGFKVVFLGGRQAGCVGLLTVIAAGCRIQGVVAYDSTVDTLATRLGLPLFASVKQPELERLLSDSDLLVSVHSREIVPKRLLGLPHFGGINVHPCLYRYKGSNPIGRLLEDGCTQASVGVHRMTESIDEGEVLVEEFVDVSGKRSVEEVYNVLYPFYTSALLKALRILGTSDASDDQCASGGKGTG